MALPESAPVAVPGSRLSGALLPLALAGLALLLLAVLGWMTLRCGGQGYGRLFYVWSNKSPGPDIRDIEAFVTTEFLITYEIEGPATAEAHHAVLPVTQIATNGSYASVLGYPALSGGFISAAAWKAGQREVVLNGAAAFLLFGNDEVIGLTLTLDGTSRLVAGVIDDGVDEPRVYIPSGDAGTGAAGVSGNPGSPGDAGSGNRAAGSAPVGAVPAGSLMILLDDSRVSADYAVSALKQPGLYDSSYSFINLGKAAAAFGQRLAVGIRVSLMVALVLLLRRCVAALTRQLPVYRGRLQHMYPRDALAADKVGFAKSCLTVLAITVGLVALVRLAIQALAICLGWQDLLPAGHAWATGSFAGRLAWLHIWTPRSQAIFALLLLDLVALLVCDFVSGRGPRSRFS